MNLNTKILAITLFFGFAFVVSEDFNHSAVVGSQRLNKTVVTESAGVKTILIASKKELKAIAPNDLKLPKIATQLKDRFNQSSAMPVIEEPTSRFSRTRQI